MISVLCNATEGSGVVSILKYIKSNTTIIQF